MASSSLKRLNGDLEVEATRRFYFVSDIYYVPYLAFSLHIIKSFYLWRPEAKKRFVVMVLLVAPMDGVI